MDAVHPHRLLVRTLATVMIAGTILLPLAATAADSDTRLELRPHCTEGDDENVFGGPTPDNPFMTKPTRGTCHEFEVRDPQTRQTNILSVGDELDMDLVVRNPSATAISRVRAWIAYDPDLLEGQEVTIDAAFTMPSPDGQNFSADDGYVKIGASTDASLSTTTVVVARIRMRVKATTTPETLLSFFHASADNSGETVVVTKRASQEQGLLHPPLGALAVRLAAPAVSMSSAPTLPVKSSAASLPTTVVIPAASSAKSSAAAPIAVSSSASSKSAAANVGSVFTLLQVQNLRVTTEGTSAYLAWDPLKSMELVGYNVYYGTVSGEYIQRRSVDKASTTLTIRNLVEGTRYYFAVRGVNKGNQETEFSQEVAVTIGKPETSTSPLLASALPQGPQGISPKTGGAVAGETGIPSSLLLFALTSAVIGTVLALRRQLSATARLDV